MSLQRLIRSFKGLFFVLGSFSLVCVIAGDLLGQSISASDVIAGYKLNASRFSHSRISWGVSEEFTEDYYRAQKRYSELFKEEANNSQISEERRAKLLDRSSQFVGDRALPPVTSYYFDHWSEGENVQVRVPLRGSQDDHKPLSAWKFPDEEVTPASLASSFGEYSIRSFVPTASARLRVWEGGGTAPRKQSVISNRSLDKISGNFRYPPLLGLTQAETDYYIHYFDSFFSAAPSDYTVKDCVGTDGAKLISIEKKRRDSVRYPDDPRLFENVVAITALVDPAQGYLPIRITETSNKFIDGVAVKHPPYAPDREIVCTEIKKFDSGYFPMNGYEILYQPDPSSKDFNLGSAERFASTGPQVPLVIGRKNTWSVSNLTLAPKTSKEMFNLEFPHGTWVYDELSGKEFLVGMSNVEFIKVFGRMPIVPDSDVFVFLIRSLLNCRRCWIFLL